MPKKCKGKRNALVVTVAAVLLGDIFAGGQNIPAQQTTWNAGDTKRYADDRERNTENGPDRRICSDITRCDEEIYRRICS